MITGLRREPSWDGGISAYKVFGQHTAPFEKIVQKQSKFQRCGETFVKLTRGSNNDPSTLEILQRLAKAHGVVEIIKVSIVSKPGTRSGTRRAPVVRTRKSNASDLPSTWCVPLDRFCLRYLA